MSWIAFHPFYTANNQGPLFSTAEMSTSMGVLLAPLPISFLRHHHFGDFWEWIFGGLPTWGPNHPMMEKSMWLITMVIVSPLRIGLVLFEMPCNRLNEPLTNWGDPPRKERQRPIFLIAALKQLAANHIWFLPNIGPSDSRKHHLL